MITILETNIIDFVGFCEKFDKPDIISFMNENYFKIIHNICLKYSGKIGAIFTDKQFIYWDFKNTNKNILNSCNAAINIYKSISNKVSHLGKYSFQMNIAIVTGEAIIVKDLPVGVICNICMQLISIGKKNKKSILIDETTCNGIKKNRLKYLELDISNMKLIKQKVFELLIN